jgi:type II secretory pathway pseudopilin PulG
VAGVLGLVVAGVLGILLINTKTNENSFRIADLQKQESALDSQQQDLDNQLAIVSSPGSLDAAARRLGLVKAQPAVIRLPDGKIIGMLRPADGKTSVTAQDAAGSGDKGAANIVPEGSASGQPGLNPNGTGTNGTGTGTNGTGTGANGTGANGTGANGTGTNGTAANGQTGDGAVANGAAGNGTNATVDSTGR